MGRSQTGSFRGPRLLRQRLIDSNGNNALGGLARNTSGGKLTVTRGQALSDSAAALANPGTLIVASVEGEFFRVKGTMINSSEEFSVVYNANRFMLDVVPVTASSAWPSDPSSAGAAGPSSTPEPASLLLLVTGLIAVLVGHRYRSGSGGKVEP